MRICMIVRCTHLKLLHSLKGQVLSISLSRKVPNAPNLCVRSSNMRSSVIFFPSMFAKSHVTSRLGFPLFKRSNASRLLRILSISDRLLSIRQELLQVFVQLSSDCFLTFSWSNMESKLERVLGVNKEDLGYA
jgi:hypothetical protein